MPCSVRQVMLELLGQSAEQMEEGFLQNVAEAVLHYFKQDLGWTSVSVGEFSLALAKVLRSFGFECPLKESTEPISCVLDADLSHLATATEAGFELFFFTRLREELRCRLDQSPRVVQFRGLRQCVKQLTGAKRWTPRCQDLNDRIVDYLRTCLQTEQGGVGCALVVV